MPCIAYEQPKWLRNMGDSFDIDKVPDRSTGTVSLIANAMSILDDYAKQGYQLTLRQLYYQFVARDLIPNTQREYNRLGKAISHGRMWGLIDWDHIIDRGRNLIQNPHWDDAGDVISAAASSFRLDLWLDAIYRVEVWVEKQALEEVVAKAATPWDCSYLACKGYMSQSEMWAASQRIMRHAKSHGQQTVIIHLGDHDPSGLDMTRDIRDRLGDFHVDDRLFMVKRIALNMDQINHYGPPPNPAKQTDSRFQTYLNEYGDESWELDALEPAVLNALIQEQIEEHVDDSYYQRERDQEDIRRKLGDVVEHWDDVEEFIAGL